MVPRDSMWIHKLVYGKSMLTIYYLMILIIYNQSGCFTTFDFLSSNGGFKVVSQI